MTLLRAFTFKNATVGNFNDIYINLGTFLQLKLVI
jgi:hypothetical protein